MPEDVTAQRKITFKTGLPLGRHATFKEDGEFWIAVPASKYAAITTVTDRLIGVLNNLRGQMTRWVSAHPGDADRVVMLLQTIQHAHDIAHQASIDKTKAKTA